MNGNVAQVNQVLADASIEEIEAMALAQESGSAAANDGQAKDGQIDGEGKQDVSAPSGQTEGQQAGKESDKEVNFAKLRTKTEALEREKTQLAEENRRLQARQYVSELSPDHAQKVADVEARMADISTKFQNGEITYEKMQEQNRAAQAEKDGLLAASIKAQISAEMKAKTEKEAAEQAATQAESDKVEWSKTIEVFFDSKPDAVDYKVDTVKQKDLDVYVKALAADPDNANQPMEWFLQQGHALVKAKHGIAAANQPANKQVQEKEAKPASPIITLSDLPGGITPAKSEIEQFDQSSGAALTNRFMNMTPAQIDAEIAKLG